MQDNLTLRELEVLRLAAQGLKNHEIAARMELALKTIEHMLGCSDPYRALYPKIGVTNRAEAIAWYCDTVGIADEGKKITERLSEHLLEMYTDYAERVYTLRIGGQPGLARDMASFLIAHTTRAAQDAATPAYREAFLRVRATGLVEQGMLHLETTPPSQILSRIKPIFVTLQAMGQELHDDDLVALAYATLAGAYNIAKDYRKGHKLYAQALTMAKSVNLQLRILRGLGIAATYLQNKERVATVKQQVQAVIDGGRFTSLEQVCETTEGLARAQGLMGLVGADK